MAFKRFLQNSQTIRSFIISLINLIVRPGQQRESNAIIEEIKNCSIDLSPIHHFVTDRGFDCNMVVADGF